MIAACGGTARTADPEVARLALEYARSLLMDGPRAAL